MHDHSKQVISASNSDSASFSIPGQSPLAIRVSFDPKINFDATKKFLQRSDGVEIQQVPNLGDDGFAVVHSGKTPDAASGEMIVSFYRHAFYRNGWLVEMKLPAQEKTMTVTIDQLIELARVVDGNLKNQSLK